MPVPIPIPMTNTIPTPIPESSLIEPVKNWSSSDAGSNYQSRQAGAEGCHRHDTNNNCELPKRLAESPNVC